MATKFQIALFSLWKENSALRPRGDAESHPWPPSHHLAASLQCSAGRAIENRSSAFSLVSRWPGAAKPNTHPFQLRISKWRSPWAHRMRPEFPSFFSSPILCVAAYTSPQVHGKWSASVNDFFIYVRERPIRQIQWDKFREFVSSRHFQVWLCSGAQTQNRLVKIGSFLWKKFISMERNTRWVKTAKHQHVSLVSWKELPVNKLNQTLTPQSGGGETMVYIQEHLGVLSESLISTRKLNFLSIIIFSIFSLSIINNYW